MSVTPVVSDTSPLIALSKIEKLSLLRDLYTEVLIPRAVENEFLQKFPTDRREALDNAPWIRVVDLQDPQNAARYARLDDGEAEALALADEKGARIILIDEKKARKAAIARGFIAKRIPYILLDAKGNRLIDAIKPHLIELKNKGEGLSDSLIHEILKAAGEAD